MFAHCKFPFPQDSIPDVGSRYCGKQVACVLAILFICSRNVFLGTV